MKVTRRAFQLVLALCFVSIASGAARAQAVAKPYKPVVGQDGKDVAWVPTPLVRIEKLLDMARVTPQDFVIDLGSGDGRNVIAAAKRGARALGVEYNPDLVEVSRHAAAKEGVADKAVFLQGDMFKADISQATVLALFLLPDNLRRLTPKFLDLRPGSRIVSNGYGIEGWEAVETSRLDGNCGAWCTAYLYIVPAKVAGTWRLSQGALTLEQKFQTLSGSLSSGGTVTPIASGRLNGDQVSFTVGGAVYSGRVSGDKMSGEVKGSATGAWSAIKIR